MAKIHTQPARQANRQLGAIAVAVAITLTQVAYAEDIRSTDVAGTARPAAPTIGAFQVAQEKRPLPAPKIIIIRDLK